MPLPRSTPRERAPWPPRRAKPPGSANARDDAVDASPGGGRREQREGSLGREIRGRHARKRDRPECERAARCPTRRFRRIAAARGRGPSARHPPRRRTPAAAAPISGFAARAKRQAEAGEEVPGAAGLAGRERQAEESARQGEERVERVREEKGTAVGRPDAERRGPGRRDGRPTAGFRPAPSGARAPRRARRRRRAPGPPGRRTAARTRRARPLRARDRPVRSGRRRRGRAAPRPPGARARSFPGRRRGTD